MVTITRNNLFPLKEGKIKLIKAPWAKRGRKNMIAGCNAVTITRGSLVYPARNKMQQDKTITQPYKRGVNAMRDATKNPRTNSSGGTALPGVKSAIKSNRQRGFTVSTIVFCGWFLLFSPSLFSSPLSLFFFSCSLVRSLVERVAETRSSSERNPSRRRGCLNLTWCGALYR